MADCLVAVAERLDPSKPKLVDEIGPPGEEQVREAVDRAQEIEGRLRTLRAQRREDESWVRNHPDDDSVEGMRDQIEMMRRTETRLADEADALRDGRFLPDEHAGVYRLTDELELDLTIGRENFAEVVNENRERLRALGPDGDSLVRIVDGWTSAKADREALDAAIREEEPWAVRGLEVLRHAPETKVELYRGMHFHDQAMYDVFTSIEEGDVIPAGPVTSWTSNAGHAQQFVGADGDGVFMVIDPGQARAIGVEAFSNSPFEHEWLTTGDFRVVEVVKEPVIDEDEGFESMLVTVYVEMV